MPVRLWETEHPYYCAQGCFFERGCHVEHASWPYFVASGWAGNDEDMNLLFRWDWCEGEDEGVPDGEARLRLYFFLQRKGYPISHEVAVTRDDEPDIRAWLEARWLHMQKLWSPFAGAS
jgi:hypothetical protein